MAGIDYIHDALLIFISVGMGWLISYFQQKGRNTAYMSDNRDMSYETTKGQNLAAEEDQIQLTHKERLIKVLYLAEKINQAQNKYQLYFYDNTSRAKFDQLVEDLNGLLTDLYHEQRLVNLFLAESQQKMLEEMVTNASGIVVEMSINSVNAASRISQFNQWMERTKLEPQNAFNYTQAGKSKEELDQMKNKRLDFANDYKRTIDAYANWLSEYIKQDIRTIEVSTIGECGTE